MDHTAPRTAERRERSQLAGGATLSGLAGFALGAVAGVGATPLLVDMSEGLAGLAWMIYGLHGAVIGTLVGSFVGFWRALRLRASPVGRARLALFAAFLVAAELAAVAVAGAPPPLDLDPLGVDGGSPWFALAVVFVPGPAALLAHHLGPRFSR